MSFFDPNTVEEVAGGFTPLAPGWYRTMVEGAQTKTTKAGNGKYVSVVLGVIDGPGKGRKLFCNFNIDNPSPQATQIGKGQFKRFLKAAGITTALATETEMQTKVQHKVLYTLVGICRDFNTGEMTSNEAKDWSNEPKAMAQPVKVKDAADLGIPF